MSSPLAPVPLHVTVGALSLAVARFHATKCDAVPFCQT
jgi:hypothetical protein